MGLSIWQILIVAVVVILLFGRGKVSELMGDVGKGIKSFKKGLNDADENADALEESAGEVIEAKAEDKSSSSTS